MVTHKGRGTDGWEGGGKNAKKMLRGRRIRCEKGGRELYSTGKDRGWKGEGGRNCRRREGMRRNRMEGEGGGRGG